jgi:hypothetical protein
MLDNLSMVIFWTTCLKNNLLQSFNNDFSIIEKFSNHIIAELKPHIKLLQ